MKRLLSALTFLFVFIFVQASPGRYIIRHISANEGLSHNAVRAILVDRLGFVWFGTSDGLNRYDGKNIKLVKAVDCYPDNNYILSLCQSGNGLIWIGTGIGVCVYDPVTEVSRRFPLYDENREEVRFSVYQILKDDDGGVWIPSARKGLFRIDPSDGSVRHYDVPVAAMCFSSDGSIFYLSSDFLLYKTDTEFKSVDQVSVSGANPFLDRRIHKMDFAFGRIFVDVSGRTVIVDPITGSVTNKGYGKVLNTVDFSGDRLWVASWEGTCQINSRLETVSCYPRDISDRYAVHDDATLCISDDGDEGVWIGTFLGAYHFVRNVSDLRRYYPRSNDDIVGRSVRGIVSAPDGTMWLGTESMGLLRFFPSEERFDQPVVHGLPKNINGLCLDGTKLWLGFFSYPKLLACLDTKTLKIERFSVPMANIMAICRLRDGGLALGGTGGLAIFRDGRTQLIDWFPYSVRHIMEDREGRLWISTAHDGLWRCRGPVDDRTSIWTSFRFDSSNPASIPSDKVNYCYEDHQSNIWVGTEVGGLCVISGKKENVERMGPDKGFPTGSVHSISEDSGGTLWIPTNKGLFYYNPGTKLSGILTVKEDFLSNQYSYSSNHIDASGYLYLGSGDGLTVFRPTDLTSAVRNTKILFTSFSSVGNGGQDGLGDGILHESISLASEITLPYRYNYFSIGVSAFNSISSDVSCEYRIIGHDDNWSPLENGRITASRLHPGHYVLQVRPSKLSAGKPESSKNLRITVKMPLMLSVPFLILYLCLLALAAWGLSHLISGISARKLLEKGERLEQEKEKNLYSAKFEFVTNIAHEIRTPLSLIQGPLENIKGRLPESLDPDIRDDMDTVCRNSERLSDLISQLMEFRNIETKGISLNVGYCDITMLISKVFKRFRLIATKKKIALSLSMPKERISAYVDAEALDRILSNLLSNSLKYSSSFARFTLSADDDVFTVCAENDGDIVPASMREQIFKPFVRYSHGNFSIEGTGIGLSTSRSLAQMHGGTLVMDKSDSLNRFVLTIPLNGRKTESPALEVASSSQSAGELSVENGSLAGKKMLIVDDNEDMRNFLVRHFGSVFHVDSAINGKDAISRLGGYNIPDIVICDVMMPVMDGFEFCSQLRGDENTCHIPVVLLTAKTDVGSKIEGLDNGADAYVEKPFTVEYLDAVVKAIIANREYVRRHFRTDPFTNADILVSNSTEDKFVSNLESFLEQNLSNDRIKMEDIAAAAYMSKSNLQRKMHSAFGMSANEYLILFRLKKASRILCSEDVSIAEVSERVGFSSHTYFTICFKKQFGLTPKEFRTLHATKQSSGDASN